MNEDLMRRGVEALERIADALDAAIAVPPAPGPIVRVECSHPAEKCVDLGGMGEGAIVHCTACRQDVPREVAHV